MIWSFLAVLFSGWLYVDASYRGPQWQRWVFKPVTMLLLLALAWQAPVLQTTDYLILLGVLATLIGDALTLLPTKRMLYAIGAFFLSHLLYTLYFASQMTLSVFWPVPLVLLIVGAVVIATVWSRLDDLRWPICTFFSMGLLMVWLATERYFFLPSENALTLMAGAILLLLGNIVWLVSHYRRRFSADSAIIAACYFGGHFMMVRALWL